METPFSSSPQLDTELYNHYVWIRNRLRRVDPNGAVHYFISKLPKTVSVDHQDWRFYEPWLIYCLLRWSIEEASFVAPKEQFTETIGQSLINYAKNFQNHFRLKSELDIALFFKNLAVQQFWHQQPFSWRELLIEWLLFCNLDKMHSLRTLIVSQTQFEPFELLELALVVNLLFEDESTPKFSIEPTWFKNLSELYPETAVIKYLNLMSKDPNSLEALICSQRPQRRSLAVELFDDPIFIECPLLRTNKNYVLYSPALFVRSATFILRRLIDTYGDTSTKQKFQRRFENLALEIGKETGKVHLTEDNLITMLPGKSIVDFVMRDGDVNIFVECKAVETSESLIRARDPQQLYRAIKSNMFKGLGQGGKCLSELKKIDPQNFSGANKNYLLIVSLSDVFLPFGDLILKYSEKERVDSLRTEVGNSEELLGFDSISVLSIRDFLLLIEMDYGKSSSLAESMLTVKNNNGSNTTRKMDFAGNFSKAQMGDGILTPMFEKAKKTLFSRLSDALEKKSQESS